MSYLAIARKWRPTTFDQIAGQVHVTRTLQNAIRLGRVHHAFLFTGARGVGKTTAARVLARALNCDQGPTPEPCGVCPSCVEIFAGTSPDVIEIDGASNNSVDDVRDLRESVRYLPQRGRTKIYIIDEVHMLSKGAFNALLKTLEEPPDHVVFIFATTEPQKIPDTILSRVQRFDFKRIPNPIVVRRLKEIVAAEGSEIPDDALRLVARAGEGSMRDAQSLLDRILSFTGGKVSLEEVVDVLGLVDRELLYTMLEGMIRGEADQCLAAIDQVYTYGYDLSEFTAELLELLRNATMVGLSPSSHRYLDLPEDEHQRLTRLADGVGPEVFVRSFQVLLDVHDQVSRAQRPRLVLEMAVARLVTIRPARPMDQLIDRLGALERRLRQAGGRPRERGGQSRSARSGRADDEPEPAPRRQDAPRAATASPRPSAPPARPQAPPAPPQAPPARPQAPPARPQAPPARPEAPPAPHQAPQPAAPTGSPAERFAAMQASLDELGARYDVWSRDAALLDVRPPALLAVLPTQFKVGNARKTAADPVLLEHLARFFPDCTRLEVSLRADQTQTTPREVMAAERRQLLEGLRQQLTDEPVVQRLRKELGAELVDVCPPDETPRIMESLS